MKDNKLVDKVDRSFEVIAEQAIRLRWLIVLASMALLAVGLFFASKAHVDNSVNAYFDKTDPSYIAYLDYLEDFSSDEVTYIIYRVPDSEHGPFDMEAMRKVGQLTQAFEDEVPFIREATSLANVEFIRAEGDSINVDELLIDFPETQQQLLAIRDVVLSKPAYVDYLINEEANYAAIVLEMDRSSTDLLEDIVYDPEQGEQMMNLYPQVSDTKVREILARPEYDGIEFFLSGDVPMNSAYNVLIGNDSAIITLVTLGLIVVLSMVLFRATPAGIFGPITVVILSLVLTVGFIGFIGWDIGLFFAMIPTLICAVGVAQSVHILLEFQRVYTETGDRNGAVKASLRKVGGPCLMAALTTAAGFFVMTVSELKALSELAVYSSVGVLITFLLSVSLLIVFIARSPKSANKSNKKSTEKAGKRRGMAINPLVLWIVDRAVVADLKHRYIVLAVSAVIIIFSLVGLTKLKVDFNFLKEFKPHVEWRQHTELAERVMGGILNVTYIIDTKTENGVKNPKLLQAVEGVQRYAEQHPLVKKSFSITDVIKDLNRSFNGDDLDYHVIPDANNLVAQYFLVYEMSGGDELDDVVSLDFSRTVLEFRVEITEASNILALLNEIDTYLEEHPIPGAEVRKTGIGLMWVKIAEYIGDTQMKSYALVFAMVATFMCISFGSIRVGMLSMIPNLAPVVITLGIMGWIGVHLDYMKLLLATIAIGIAVDDTIHLVTRYRARFLQTGNYELALQKSLSDVGPALVVTSIILVGSFSSYLFGNTTILSSFGVLLGAAISIALLADLFLMPVLILVLKPFGEEFDAAGTKVGETAESSVPVS